MPAARGGMHRSACAGDGAVGGQPGRGAEDDPRAGARRERRSSCARFRSRSTSRRRRCRKCTPTQRRERRRADVRGPGGDRADLRGLEPRPPRAATASTSAPPPTASSTSRRGCGRRGGRRRRRTRCGEPPASCCGSPTRRRARCFTPTAAATRATPPRSGAASRRRISAAPPTTARPATRTPTGRSRRRGAAHAHARSTPIPRTAVGARLDRIEIAGRDAAGRAEKILLRGTRTFVVRGEVFREVVTRALGVKSLRSTLFTVKKSARHASSFSGKGFGHGVGLCQAGALARLRAGASADDVLAHYFPGTTLAIVNPDPRIPDRRSRSRSRIRSRIRPH